MLTHVTPLNAEIFHIKVKEALIKQTKGPVYLKCVPFITSLSLNLHSNTSFLNAVILQYKLKKKKLKAALN